MRWWPFTRNAETKASAAGGVISFPFVGRPVWTDRDYAALADESYVRNAVAFKCVKLISSSAATASWILSDRRGKEIDNHPLLDLLAKPGPMVGGNELFEALFAYLLIAGNGYLEGVGPDGKPPRELWALRPDRTQVVPGPTAMPAAYEYTANGVRYRWDVDPLTGKGPILHLKEFHPLNDWYGLSRVEPAAYGVDRHNAASAHNKALLDNGARPSGALVFQPVTVDGKTITAPDPVLKKAEADLASRHGGPGNAGRPFVFGGNVKWEDMSTSPKDMDFQAGKEDAARDICLAFGVPHILVVPGASTYNNVREAKLELWEDTILPLMDRVTDKLNTWLCPQFGDGLKLSVDLDDISALEPRREAKRKSVTDLLDKGVIDDDEAREALQYAPRAPGAVKKIDPQVLSALVSAADKDGVMFEPLFRYVRSVGLVDADVTLEAFAASGVDGLDNANDPELAAGNTAPPTDQPPPREDPAAEESADAED